MAFPITLAQDEYEALVELARQSTLAPDGSVASDKARALESYLVMLEKKNDIQRYTLWVQWQETDSPVPPGSDFPKTWPPEFRAYLAMTSRPIAKSDVLTLVKNRARKPMAILVTRDPGANVGWSELDVFFK